MATPIARTAHGSGIAAAHSEARTAREAVSACCGGGGGGVSGPCHPARAGTKGCVACGSASSRLRSGRIGVAVAGTKSNAAKPAIRSDFKPMFLDPFTDTFP